MRTDAIPTKYRCGADVPFSRRFNALTAIRVSIPAKALFFVPHMG